MARKPAAPQRSPLTPFYLVLAVVALAGAGALLYQILGDGGGDAATAPVPVEIDPAELSRVQGIAMGEETAPVVIYEFADFQCPACGQFAALMGPLIKERLVDTGMVRYVFYDFPLSQHPHAFLAARAGRCANAQGKFWPYHDLVFARQPSWATLSTGDAADYFVELGDEAGLDGAAFESCVRSEQFAEEVTRSLRLGESLGVQGTPSLFINGQRLTEIPRNFSDLEAQVRAAAGNAAPADSAAAGV